jgi:hypothetical protein
MPIAKPSAKDIDLHGDAWRRFERAVDAVAKSPPQHRKSKAKGRKSPTRKRNKKPGK